MKFQLHHMEKNQVWQNYQNKYFNKSQPDPILSDNNYSSTSYNEKIELNEREIADIDAKLNNVLTRKDELRLIELNKISNKKNIVQTKTIQNSAYRELQATEDGLLSQKNQLQQEINIAKDKLNQGGLDSQAGEQFSAGVSLDPVMDQDRVIPDVPTAPAMTASERAKHFDKEDTLLNPNFTIEDVAQGLANQGKSYFGGDSTILDRAMASPAFDLHHSLTNPSEYQLAQDYGYTHMDTSAKEIKNNPAKFTGNVAGFVGAEVALTLGTMGAGKVVLKGGKIVKNIVKPVSDSGLEDIPRIPQNHAKVAVENNINPSEYNLIKKYASDFINTDPAPQLTKFISTGVKISDEGVTTTSSMSSKSPTLVDGKMVMVDDVIDGKIVNEKVLVQAFKDAKTEKKIMDSFHDPRSSTNVANRVSGEKINPNLKLNLNEDNIHNLGMRFKRTINKMNPTGNPADNIVLSEKLPSDKALGFVEITNPNKIYLQKNNIGATPEEMVNVINHESVHNVLNKEIGIVATHQWDNLAYASSVADKQLHRIGIGGKHGKIGLDKVVETPNTPYEQWSKNDVTNKINDGIAKNKQIEKQKSFNQLSTATLGVLGVSAVGVSAKIAIGSTPSQKKKKSNRTKKSNSFFNFKY